MKMILTQRKYNMIEGVCIYIGKIIGRGATSKNSNGVFIYFVSTPYHVMKYMKTESKLKEGELVFYIEVTTIIPTKSFSINNLKASKL
jgi:hypothetical protein